MTEFGVEVTADDIVETLGFFDGWEERYKYIIDLGKELPPLDDGYKTEQNLVRGCQSQVWLVSDAKDGKLYFHADSDAFIVKGLLAVVLAAYNGKTPAEVTSFDIDAYFGRLNLLNHLSATRGNGLKAMVQRIQAIASA
ncbi:SufE family protein [Gilvimarinus sp. DA14]|uniref:SufE family protein n=1 Tax=Gilvimarinus sp. DA14 TaxID=2956798 RepID=UPI0020B6CBE8|nr:SufE family protein [Gilvimarinus sp. DA14]UTF60869.1 SufE family protein [Gilvimarinus sp. DA14]